MNDELERRTRSKLNRLAASGLRRELKPPDAGAVDLCSNDYLGLANDERLRAAMTAEIGRTGCGATASRLLRGEHEIFGRVERRFAEFKGAERALFFNSGYAANTGVLTAFPETGDVIFSDALNHASIIDGVRLSRAAKIVFPHNDAEALADLIERTPCAGQRFCVVESLFSMDGDIAPLARYAEICRATDTALIVDEAHAVGVFGATGSGLIEQDGIADAVFLSINTAGKALGAAGAFVCGAEWAIDFLINRARPFIFSTALPPAVAAALLAALEIVERKPERRARLLNLSAFLRAELNASGFSVSEIKSQIIPIIIGDNTRAVRVAAELQQQGFDVRAVRPPTVPENTARLRVSLNSELSESVLREFVRALMDAVR